MKTSRKWLVLPLIIAIVFVALGPTTSKPVAAQDQFKVAVVMPSAADDLAFSQSMVDALNLLSDEMDGFSFDVQDGTFVVDDAAAALRDWAASGDYDLIIAHGSQYGAVIEELAPEFPDTSFAWGTDVNTFGLDNVFAYTAAAEEGGYVEGVLAANLTQTGTVGIVGPIEVGDAKAYIDGFVNGVDSTGMATALEPIYIGSFSDVALATEAAETLRANGADVLTGSAQMVVGAIGVAKENNLLWLGTQASQADLAAESGVAFQVYHWEVILSQMIDSIKSGTLGGESYTLTLENGGLVIEYGQYQLSDDMLKLVDDTVAGIVDGSIQPLPMTEENMEPMATEEAGD